MSPNPGPEQLREIDEKLFAGQVIAAIKLARAASGCSLAAAKAFVEARREELRASAPERFPARSAGCLGIIVAFLVLSGLFALSGVWRLL